MMGDTPCRQCCAVEYHLRQLGKQRCADVAQFTNHLRLHVLTHHEGQGTWRLDRYCSVANVALEITPVQPLITRRRSCGTRIPNTVSRP